MAEAAPFPGDDLIDAARAALHDQLTAVVVADDDDDVPWFILAAREG